MAHTLAGEGVVQVAARVLSWFRDCPGALVAFSGGVDSAVVAKAAFLALGTRSIAVTADSPSLARQELLTAKSLATTIGIEHRVLETQEALDPNYLRNDNQRCYHCKSHLYDSMASLLDHLSIEPTIHEWWLVSGTNRDDLGDFRPGLRAASERQVRSPLAELGISKLLVRELANYWQLPVADKPASPCLASRIAYGLAVTPERLRKIESAETELRALGFTEFRVRLHADDLARIEIPIASLSLLTNPTTRQRIVSRFHELGFQFVTLDLEGFSSGSLNRLVMPILTNRDSRDHS